MIFIFQGGVKPEEYDQFHEFILLDETSRTGCYVSASAYAAGLSIGLPPVLDFGSKYLKEKVCLSFLSKFSFWLLTFS